MSNQEFDLLRKHIFILSSAGKPIFSRHGDEQELVTTFGLLQAIISIVQDSGDSIKCIRSKRRKIVYFLRGSLYFVAISSTNEPEAVLSSQLEFMYSQILLVLTARVHDILENNSSRDLRDLLGPETTRILHASCKNDMTSPYISFQCMRSFPMLSDLRKDINQALLECVDRSGSA
jgi:vacuolar fusion protein MON1